MPPRRRQRSAPAPAPDGTWARCVESVFCHERDCFPRILCLLPLTVSLIFAISFSPLNRSITSEGPAKEVFCALGAVGFAAIAVFLLSGMPVCRRCGCRKEECANGLRAALSARPGAPAKPPRTAEAPEHALPAGSYAAANPLAAAQDEAGATGGHGPFGDACAGAVR